MAGTVEIATLVWSIIVGILIFLLAYTPLGKWITRKSQPIVAALGVENPDTPLPSDQQGILDALERSYDTYQQDRQVIIRLLTELKSESVEHHGRTHDSQRGIVAAIAAASADDRAHARDLARQDHDFFRELNRQRGRVTYAAVNLGVGRILRELPQLLSRGEKTDSENRHRRRNSA
ncbi:hypothetical protein F5Y00DRAFT_227345 [Daldinia vernicosa]|uniref:uncharacterized protein n=1 Tax=Daldinia vernicosa TaxID=114800 RepID=UPI002007C0D3|nr:uncharacterized protein F5Y00DRAFT_227345 [Daldinia vernicosa]KAI0852688.1 hypothetical protein F5Y00DRAFT_227345 [Daldinia vernicosa]